MWQYALLASVLVHGGLAIGLFLPQVFALGGWFGGAALLFFAGWLAVTRRAQAAA